jgi:hypothetical protein
VNRGTPYGSEDWTMRIANMPGLEFTLHPRGIDREEKSVESSEKVCVPFSFPTLLGSSRRDITNPACADTKTGTSVTTLEPVKDPDAVQR